MIVRFHGLVLPEHHQGKCTHYIDWLDSATNAQARYLAGELSEEEAIAIIYVPRKDELLEQISAELTLETAAT